MSLDLNSLLDGSPSYGVVYAKDGVLLFRRHGHEAAFRAIAANAMRHAGEDFTITTICDSEHQCDRLFIATLDEDRSFAR